MSHSFIDGFCYDFTTSNYKLPKEHDIVPHYIIYMKNIEPNRPNKITISDYKNNKVHQLEIIWKNNFGLVNFNKNQLNLRKLHDSEYSIKDRFSDNYIIYTHGIFCCQEKREHLRYLDLFI